jgi:SAM-dependent methyltransferase
MTDNTITNSEEDFDWFRHNGIYMPMINDTGRNVYYKQAIEAAVPGKVVCDIGTGTGLLSILAAKAGAEKVYSVEMDPGRADFARKIIHQVGLSNRIEVIHKNFFDTDIHADIFVSETIGTPVFNEDIIAIAKHATRHGGQFIPGSFDLWVEIYDDHPIFPLVMPESSAFEFQPDIDIDPAFEKIINDSFQSQHPLDSTIYRAGYVENLFTMLPRFTDLKLKKLYQTEPLHIDLNGSVDINNISITVPADKLPTNTFVAVLFWRANMYDNIVMKVNETWWGNPAKTILPHLRKPNTDFKMWYDHKITGWRLQY